MELGDLRDGGEEGPEDRPLGEVRSARGDGRDGGVLAEAGLAVAAVRRPAVAVVAVLRRVDAPRSRDARVRRAGVAIVAGAVVRDVGAALAGVVGVDRAGDAVVARRLRVALTLVAPVGADDPGRAELDALVSLALVDEADERVAVAGVGDLAVRVDVALRVRREHAAPRRRVAAVRRRRVPVVARLVREQAPADRLVVLVRRAGVAIVAVRLLHAEPLGAAEAARRASRLRVLGDARSRDAGVEPEHRGRAVAEEVRRTASVGDALGRHRGRRVADDQRRVRIDLHRVELPVLRVVVDTAEEDRTAEGALLERGRDGAVDDGVALRSLLAGLTLLSVGPRIALVTLPAGLARRSVFAVLRVIDAEALRTTDEAGGTDALGVAEGEVDAVRRVGGVGRVVPLGAVRGIRGVRRVGVDLGVALVIAAERTAGEASHDDAREQAGRGQLQVLQVLHLRSNCRPTLV